MNLKTLLKLQANPYYKLNKQQEAELEQKQAESVTTFGAIRFHSNNVPIHDTNPKKVSVMSKVKNG